MTAPDLVVWRHGRTEWNRLGRIQGHLDPALDDVGRAEAAAAAAVLTAYEPAALVTSDSSRARSTAVALAARTGLPVVTDVRLREVDMGTWSGLTRDEVAARYPDEFADWLAGVADRCGGGESHAEVAARAMSCVGEFLADGAGPLVVVTHGGTARALVCALLGLPGAARRAFAPLGNAAWASLTRSRSGVWRLASYGSSAAVPGVTLVGSQATAADFEPPPGSHVARQSAAR